MRHKSHETRRDTSAAQATEVRRNMLEMDKKTMEVARNAVKSI